MRGAGEEGRRGDAVQTREARTKGGKGKRREARGGGRTRRTGEGEEWKGCVHCFNGQYWRLTGKEEEEFL